MAKYSKAAEKNVASAIKKMEKGTLKSGRSGKKVTDPKQAIAIGLSEARKKGATVPKKKAVNAGSAKAAASKKVAKKSTSTPVKKAAVKKTGIKKAAPKKSSTRKIQTKKKTAAAKKTPGSMEEISVNLGIPPVEEKSPQLQPVAMDKTVDPMMLTDKKALAKAVTRQDFRHHLQPGVKHGIRPSGKKPLWR